MLPKLERLKDKHLFNLAFKLGKTKKQKFNSNLLTLYYLFKEKDINRFIPKTAFIVGLRVDKKSNKRNLVKRRMKASYQILRKKLINSYNSKISVLIWIAHPAITSATFQEIKDTMEALLNRLVKVENVGFSSRSKT